MMWALPLPGRAVDGGTADALPPISTGPLVGGADAGVKAAADGGHAR